MNRMAKQWQFTQVRFCPYWFCLSHDAIQPFFFPVASVYFGWQSTSETVGLAFLRSLWFWHWKNKVPWGRRGMCFNHGKFQSCVVAQRYLRYGLGKLGKGELPFPSMPRPYLNMPLCLNFSDENSRWLLADSIGLTRCFTNRIHCVVWNWGQNYRMNWWSTGGKKTCYFDVKIKKLLKKDQKVKNGTIVGLSQIPGATCTCTLVSCVGIAHAHN